MVAQTNLQLYNQLRAEGRPVEEMVVVHRAYELLTTLYAGHYQADGKPFVAHGVGVASIVAELGQPADFVAAALLHNVYGNADFGDRAATGVTPFRRGIVRDAVGERIEELLIRFRDVRIYPHTLDAARGALPGRDETDRRLILIELADQLEKYVDLGILYFGENDWLVESEQRMGAGLVEIARSLGEPRLADMLERSFAEAAAQAGAVPAELRASDGRRQLKLVVPRSCRRRPSLELRDRIGWWRWRLQHDVAGRLHLRRVIRSA